MSDWLVFAYWSIGCFVFGAVLAWTRGEESNWFSYAAQALVVAALWLPLLLGAVIFFLGCVIAGPFVRWHAARKKRERVEAAKIVVL